MSSGLRYQPLAERKMSFTPVMTSLLQRAAINSSPVHDVPPIVHEVLRAPGQPLDAATRAFMEPRFGHDFSGVRMHTDARAAESARAVNALAYTVGQEVVFGAGQYAQGTHGGIELMAHELVHVKQQDGRGAESISRIATATAEEVHEAEADRAADAVARGTSMPSIGRAEKMAIQRRVEMRDVGRGEQSGFARLPELVVRLNAMSQGLTFSVNGQELAYEVRQGGTLSDFDQQMMGFIDQDPVIPLRLTIGLLTNGMDKQE